MISLKTTTKNDINGSDPSVRGLQFEGMKGALIYVGELVVSPIWEASLAWESGVPGSEAEQLPLLGKAPVPGLVLVQLYSVTAFGVLWEGGIKSSP